MSGHAIEFEGVTFAYPNGKQVFRDATFHLHAGERVGLWGANGCGKTTFFRLLTGLERPSSGRIAFEGRELAREEDFRAARLALGLVLQNAEDQLFFPEVWDDVAFGPYNQGLDDAAVRERVAETLRALDMEGLAHALSAELSGGQKKLVALATVLSMRPRVLLLDEPTNALDVDASARILQVVADLAVPMVVVSHDVDVLLATCSRFVSIVDGRFVELDAPVPHTHRHVHFLGGTQHTHG